MTTYHAKKADEHNVIQWTDTENETWHKLISRQQEIVANRACKEFLQGLETLNMAWDHVPQCSEINKVLQETTGWSVTPVPSIIPEKHFYTLLANKQFPAASFIRIPEELDYLQEPDIFHEYYGHCPLLTHRAYADFIEWYGKTALKSNAKGLAILARLFWFTIEFGLMKIDEQFKVYGGGILSSKEETIYAAESDIPVRRPLHITEALRTPYRHDQIQKLYFYIEDMQELYKIQDVDLLETMEKSIAMGDLPPSYNVC